ncbi:unnamed protein product [Rotaria magnacalcarata]|nr:unnamed protein product [Rotaria magnacalcarata]
MMYVTQKQYCSILRQMPNLKSFTLNDFSLHKTDENVTIFSRPIFHEQLPSLILTDSRKKMMEPISFLSLTPLLTYLKIICVPAAFDTIVDGFRWERFLGDNLTLLHNDRVFYFQSTVPVEYLFRHLTKLTIDVDQEWSIECVEFLSKIIDLFLIDKITFNPDLNLKFIHNTLNNIFILMGLAYNLSTLAIHPYPSHDGIIDIENISSIIPCHIKYLEVVIKDIHSMKVILDHHEHLWSRTLLAYSDQSIPWSKFVEELVFRKNNFVYGNPIILYVFGLVKYNVNFKNI